MEGFEIVAHINSNLSGILLSTNRSYGKWLTFAKLEPLVVRAAAKDLKGDDLQYVARVPHSINPYRTMRMKGRDATGQWLIISDWPTGIHSGLEVFKFFNPAAAPYEERYKVDQKTGMMYSMEIPKEWSE